MLNDGLGHSQLVREAVEGHIRPCPSCHRCQLQSAMQSRRDVPELLKSSVLELPQDGQNATAKQLQRRVILSVIIVVHFHMHLLIVKVIVHAAAP